MTLRERIDALIASHDRLDHEGTGCGCLDAVSALEEADADERFATFGPLVPAELVPPLVRAGLTVWSRQYGMADRPERDETGAALFTTIDTGDLWRWGEESPDQLEADWGPFRLDREDV